MRVLLRDLLRQRFRTALTISGVGLGIFTLVVLGALGENVRRVVDEAKAYAGGLVRLYTKTNADGANPGITDEDLAVVSANPGVHAIGPSLVLFLDGFDLQDDPLMFMRPKPLVEGIPAKDAELIRGEGMRVLEGRWLREGDVKQAMVQDWMARRRGLAIGGQVEIRNQHYEVVGIFHAADSPMIPAAVVPYTTLNDGLLKPEVERAQRFFRQLAKNPLLAPFLPPGLDTSALDGVASEFAHKQASMFRMYMIVPTERTPEGTQRLALELREDLEHLAVIDPAKIEEGMEQAVALLLVITLVVTVISTVVGGLLIVNTMAMAVIERRREIAIKASLGATPGQIAVEFVGEAALLALVGAGLGITGGVLAILICEPFLLEMVDTGAAMFHVTPRLLVLAVVYAVTMGVVAGGIPALRAARVDPAVCLREL